MSFADALKQRAEKTGQKVIQGETREAPQVEKTETTSAFADALKKRADQTGQQVFQGERFNEAVTTTDKSSFAAALKARAQKVADAGKLSDSDFLFTTGLFPKWSFSALKVFESCPHQLKLARIDKEPQKESEAAERGSAMHQICEDYVQGVSEDLLFDRKVKTEFFLPVLDELREQYAAGKVRVEEDWGVRKDWSPCTWQDPELWGRAKLDIFVEESETSCQVLDWKTGRKFGNELKHQDQGLSYALAAMYRFPEKEVFRIRFGYLDHGAWLDRTFTRQQLLILHPRYHKRAVAMTTCTDAKAKPNMDSCRFCPYGCNTNKAGIQYGTGVCEFDHYRGQF